MNTFRTHFSPTPPQISSSRPKAALDAAARPEISSSRPKAALFAAAAERPLYFVRRATTLRTRLVTLAVTLIALLVPRPASAHVGNKDVFEQIQAGPYTLFITIRPPNVIPGVASVEVRTSGPAITSLTITPMPLTGEASKHPPTPDAMQRAESDRQFFTGSIWLMASGSMQVRFAVDGAAGPASAAVPVPAVPLSILPMQKPLGTLLAILGLILALGMAAIVAAAVRESRVAPNTQPDTIRSRRSRIAFALSLAVVAFLIFEGARWWNVEAAGYAGHLWHASDLHATLDGSTLHLLVRDPDPKHPGEWLPLHNDDMLLDHGHLMHLYAIRSPQMDAAFHLHPVPTANQGLALQLPSMPPGTYKLFADIVYANGFPETETSTLVIPASLSTAPLGPEDASAAPAPLSAGDLGPAYKLPDGYTMAWDKPASISANTAYAFRFTLLDPSGHPATDMQPYLGMAGHAAFVKADFSAFAHTHPEGSAAMPAMMLANPGSDMAMPAMDTTSMPGMSMPAGPLSPTVSFPYGFPTPGRYRIFIQMKHANTVETGVFDAEVQ